MTLEHINKIYNLTFASVYPHYIAKIKKKGRTIDELNEIIEWLTGYDKNDINNVISERITFEKFFKNAPNFQPLAVNITGTICGYKIQDIKDPIVQKTRYLDKLVDELAKGKSIDKIISKLQ